MADAEVPDNWDDSEDSEDYEITSSDDQDSEENVSETSSAGPIHAFQDLIDQKYLKFQFCEFLDDFGLAEKFLIDGDGLIVHCLSNGHLDWSHGGQHLHTIYLVEKLLSNLKERGGRFEIFFLMGNRDYFEARGPSFALCRRVAISHLQHHQQATGCAVHTLDTSWFTAHSDAETPWLRFMRAFRPTFILASNEKCEHETTSAMMRKFFHMQVCMPRIISQQQSTHYVVSMENMKTVGSRVRGYLYSCGAKRFVLEEYRANHEQLDNLETLALAQVTVAEEDEVWVLRRQLEQAFSGSSLFGELSLTTLYQLTLAVLVPSTEARFRSRVRARAFGRASLISARLAESLPLQERAFSLPDDGSADGLWGGVSEDFKADVHLFIDLLHMALGVALNTLDCSRTWCARWADVFDGRLFHLVLLHLAAGWELLPSLRLLESDGSSQADDCRFSSLGLSHLDLTEAEVKAAMRILAAHSAPPPVAIPKLLHVGGKDKLLKKVLGDVHDRMLGFEASAKEGSSRANADAQPFIPHHFHSLKPLDDEPDSFDYDLAMKHYKAPDSKDDPKSNWKREKWKLKNKQKIASANQRYIESMLEGMPNGLKQSIAELLTKEKLSKRREVAKRALEGGIDEQETIEQTGKSTAPSKAEILKQENAARLSEEKLKNDRGKWNSQVKNITQNVQETLANLKAFSDKDELHKEVQKEAKLYLLDYIHHKLPDPYRTRELFTVAQSILRRFSIQSDLSTKDKAAMADVLQPAGFHDLANWLRGSPRDLPPSGSRSSIRFQLDVVPEHLARPVGASGDERVGFPPDDWQKTLLDVVDSGNSALVVAPTASGKTFISFYAMEQCLRTDHDGVVVYVAPTKALVNQVRAEIDARFSKAHMPGSRKVASCFTRDFRDDNMLNAQILVTVPACLGILLLTGTQKNIEWASRIRHVIFDEVHNLGAPGGEIWEQLILLISSPFLALSATLGNIKKFHGWLEKVEESRGRKVYLVEHTERFNDLCNWVWTANEDGSGSSMTQVNPFWAVQEPKTGAGGEGRMFAHDFKLLPENCLKLFVALEPWLSPEDARILQPETFFSGEDSLWNLSMRQVSGWGQKLRNCLCSLPEEQQSNILRGFSVDTSLAFNSVDLMVAEDGQRPYISKHFYGLVMELKKQDMLPAICFHLDRRNCEQLARILVTALEDQEKIAMLDPRWVEKERQLKAELKQLTEIIEKQPAEGQQTDKQKGHLDGEQPKVNNTWDLKFRKQNLESQLYDHTHYLREFCLSQIKESDIKESFSGMSRGTTWRDKKYSRNGLDEALLRGIGVHHAGLSLKYRQAVERLFRQKKLSVVITTATLAQGIHMPSKASVIVGDAVYLNAMNFRQMAGRAGRRGFDLRGQVVFFGVQSPKVYRLLRADLPEIVGNLALDNSMALRLMIRQSALRRHAKAARKTHTRPASKDLAKGKKEITAKAVQQEDVHDNWEEEADKQVEERKEVREEQQEEESTDDEEEEGPDDKEARAGQEAVKRLVTYPLFDPVMSQLAEGTGLAGAQIAHCFRFSIDYLMANGLLTKGGKGQLEPNDLGAFIAHLYFTEPANFAFHSLLTADEGRLLARLCKPSPDREEKLMAILCHFFNRKGLPKGTARCIRECPQAALPKGPSKVVLDDLQTLGDLVDTESGPVREGQLVQNVLRQHNETSLRTLVNYWACFVHAYEAELGSDDYLPFSGLHLQQSSATECKTARYGVNKFFASLQIRPRVRSAFVALSGVGDKFETLQELCDTSRRGVYLDPKMLPVFDVKQAGEPLNAYLLDFFKHGQRNALIKCNHVDENEVFDLLRDFALVLKALWAAMARRREQAAQAGTVTPFNDANVADAFKLLSDKFTENLRKIAA
mmetsp:Transcript_26812/g.70420  ORF Transcript_26812/g.70420 Transcript_26812/m.70420 type:complete len:1869 (+) Transcript_26812:171-5777(+)